MRLNTALRYPLLLPTLALALILTSTLSLGKNCSKNRIVLQVLGSGGPELGDKRASSSYLIWVNGKAKILVDTGGGSSLNFEHSGAKIEDIDAILFTHLHVDHSADLPVYIKSSFFTSRDRDLFIYGPAGNQLMPFTSKFVQRLLSDSGAYAYLSDYVDRSKSNRYHIRTIDVSLNKTTTQTFKVNKDIEIKTIATHHGPIAAIAWRVNIRGVKNKICSISFSGDMSNRYQTLQRLAKGSDILVAHNAIPESRKGIARNLHMPPSEIGKIAKHANIKKLVLSHRMLRTLGKKAATQTKTIIRKYYSGPVLFANDLDRF